YDHWSADLASTADYYPGGMMMPGRNTEYSWSRMGMQGQQKDDEVYGKGNYIDMGARQYNTRILHIPTVDSKFGSYPSQSPYVAFNSNPIIFVDPTGNDGIAFWQTSGKTKTLVIKADYHYIKGQFDPTILEAAKTEFSTYKKIDYNGENVKVRFDIGFVPHDEGADLSSYDGSNGQNVLTNKMLNVPEESDYRYVFVDVEAINHSTTIDPNGNLKQLNKVDAAEKQVSSMIHGIGHNIGMVHLDGGAMDGQHGVLQPFRDFIDPNKLDYGYYFTPNHVTKHNAEMLIKRIDGMTEKGSDYWKGYYDPDGSGRDMQNDGITIFKQ
ncbi:MAG: hypothetical protein QM535_21895, partial [Limnohabitans sp.]|nr:hypothetical protein [Limnohabitans sp.]